MEIIKRKDAISLGLKVYYTGKQCKNGHITRRSVGCGKCFGCAAEYRHNNVEKEVKRHRIYREDNREKLRASHRSYKKTHKQQEAYYSALRRAKVLKATPLWADLVKIRKIYETCPKGFVVDHIVPLQGKNVCGLHVENNLQHLEKRENEIKGNKLI